MARTFEEVIRIVLEAKGAESGDALAKALEGVGTVSEETRDQLLAMASAMDELAAQEAAVRGFKALETKLVDTAKKAADLRTEVDRLGEEFIAQENPSKKLASEFQRQSDALNKLEAQQAGYAAELRRAGAALKTAGVDTSKLASEEQRLANGKATLRTAVADLARQVDAQSSSQRRANVDLRDSAAAANQSKAAVASLTGQLKALAAAAASYVGLRKLKDEMIDVLQTGDEFEGLRIRFEQAFGSVDAGADAMVRLRELAKGVPDSFASITDSALRLKAFGLDPLDGTLQALIDQNAALGGSQETLNGLILATGQAWAKQKLQGEEILQLVERGVPVWDLLAKATGKNAEELQKLSAQGKLGRDTIAALVKEMGAASDGAAAAGVSRLSALWTKLTDEVDKFYGLIADSGAMDVFKRELNDLLGTVREMAEDGTLKEYAENVAEAIVGLANGVKGAAELVWNLGSAIADTAKAIKDSIIGESIAEVAEALGLMVEYGGKGIAFLRDIAKGFLGFNDGADLVDAGAKVATDALDRLTAATERNRVESLRAAEGALAIGEASAIVKEAYLEEAKAEHERAKARFEGLTGLELLNPFEIARVKALGEQVDELQRQVIAQERANDALREAIGANEVIASMEANTAAAIANSTEAIEAQAEAIRTRGVKAMRELGVSAEVAGQEITEAGGKIITALRDVVAVAGLSSGQLNAAFTEALSKLTTTAELAEFRDMLGKLFEEGRISGERFAALMSAVAAKEREVQAAAAAAKGEIAGIGQAGEQAARKMIASMEAARAAIAVQAQDIAKRLAEAMNPDTGDASKVPGLQRQMQALDGQIGNLNQRIAQTKQQLQDAGNTGTQAGEGVQQSMQGVAQAAQEAGNAADAAGEQVGRFGRGGAVEELRQAIAAVRSEFEALGASAAQAFDDALIHAARGTNRMSELFAAINEASTATRQAYAAQQEDAARQAEQLAKLSEDAILKMVESGTTADGLRAKAKRLADQFDLLNDQDLGTLRAALDQAAGKVDALNDKARAAREALADLNAQLREQALQEAGDEEALARLRRDRELQRIKELAEQSGEANSQVVQENMRMIEERYRRELQLIKEREREEKRANKSVDSERSSGGGSGGSRGSGLGTGEHRQVDRVIRVEIPDVGNVDVVDEDSARNLERGLQEVARAARAGRRIG